MSDGSNDSLATLVRCLEQRQLASWPMVRANYADLGEVRMRELHLDHSLIVLQYNPERRRSAAAQVDAASLAARPCFLCDDHQPREQEKLEWGGGRYKIQVNPYPIFPRHLTISSTTHTPQSFVDSQCVDDMLSLAIELPDYVVFYNGPRCGASAPDHMHFQAGSKGLMPLCSELMNSEVWRDDALLEANDDGFIGYTHRLGRFLFMIKTGQMAQAEMLFDRLQVAMMNVSGETVEPLQNLLCWTEGNDYYLVVFPRAKHRPACYGEGVGQFLVSPASVDMGGLWVIAAEKDYNALTAAHIQALYDELCVDNAQAENIIDCFLSENAKK